MSSEHRTRVLIVDDDLSLRVLTTIVLAREGFSPTAVGSVPRALERVAEEPVDVVLTDLQLPVSDGLDLIRSLRQSHPGLPVVAMTGSGGAAVDGALQLGALQVIRKPFSRDELVGALRAVLDERRVAA